MASLSALPDELLVHIVDSLALARVPSQLHDAAEPSIQHCFAETTPLKAWSLASKQLRRVALPALYRYTRLRVEDLLPSDNDGKTPLQTPQLLQYISSHVPSTTPISLLLYTAIDTLTPGPDDAAEAPCDDGTIFVDRPAPDTQTIKAIADKFAEDKIHTLWKDILDILQPNRLVMLAPPATLGALTNWPVDCSDGWAFIIPSQRLELRRQPSLRITTPQTNPPSHLFRSILSSPTWTRLSYNGGSSMNVYGQYHYFDRCPPCIMNPASKPLRNLALQLTSFSYTAVFPHLAHYSTNLLHYLQEMKSLATLSLRLAPDPTSNLLNDTTVIGRGNLNLRDCWTEVERAYMQTVAWIADTREPCPLSSFTSHDCQIAGFADGVDIWFNNDSRLAAWAKTSKITWTRRESTADSSGESVAISSESSALNGSVV